MEIAGERAVQVVSGNQLDNVSEVLVRSAQVSLTTGDFGLDQPSEGQNREPLLFRDRPRVATCMFAGLTCLPALLNLATRRKNPPTKQPSADNARSTLGREEPR